MKQSIVESWISLVFPRQCVWCRRVWSYLCSVCQKKLIPHPEICPICRSGSLWWMVCYGCRHERPVGYEGIVIGFAYVSLIKKLLLQLKFWHRHDVAMYLSQRLYYQIISHEQLSQALRDRTLIVTHVPSHRYRRYRVKGYNQSLVLAQRLADMLWVPHRTIATKIKHTTSQLKMKSRSQRLTNLLWAFGLEQDCVLNGDETIVIVDDITTTGSTIACVASTIRQVYPTVTIWWVVVARNIW